MKTKMSIWRSLIMTAVLTLGLTAAGNALAAGKDSKLVVIKSPAEFETKVLKSSIPCIVDFYADWCPPCQKMLPIMDKLATAWDGKVKIVKVNVDTISSLAEKYGVSGIPDVRIFVNGKQTDQKVGFRDEEEWTEILTKLTKK